MANANGSAIGAAGHIAQLDLTNGGVAHGAARRRRLLKAARRDAFGGEQGDPARKKSKMIDEPTQAEKREVRRNDTYHSRAMADADAPGGRFQAATKTAVSGAAPSVGYPRQPAGPRVPDEPALGFAIDAMEPVGEAFEVERSLEPSPLPPLSGEALGADRHEHHPPRVGLRPFSFLPIKQRRKL